MITESTVLVLGAGASMPYGLPSGERLLRLIFMLSPVKRGCVAEACGTTLGEIKELVREIEEAWPPSIDAFLEGAGEREVFIGKGLIAAVLVQYEREETLAPDFAYSNHKTDPTASTYIPGSLWYQHLWHRLSDGCTSPEQFSENKLEVVTFNYDRSLEAFLYTRLKARYRLGEDEALGLMQTVPIIHVHGTLQPFYHSHGTTNGRPYGYPEFNAGLIADCARDIKVIHEATQEHDRDLQKATRYLARASRVGVLGFGFHEGNVERLGYHVPGRGQKLFATTYGLGMQERARGRQMLRDHWARGGGIRDWLNQSNWSNEANGVDSLQLLKDYDVLG